MGGKENECGLCFVLEDLIKISNLSLAQLLLLLRVFNFLIFKWAKMAMRERGQLKNPRIFLRC